MITKNNKPFPNGKYKAVTFSFDDNVCFDVQLAALFNKYKIKCTFNVISGMASHEPNWLTNGVNSYRLTKEEMEEAYVGHEIAGHSLTHPHIIGLDDETLAHEINQDIKNLRSWYPDRVIEGFAYPYGETDERTIALLKQNGIKWARLTGKTHAFDIPENLHRYVPTCHFLDEDIDKVVDDFLNLNPKTRQVLFIWGHSYEFILHNAWEKFEKLIEKLANRDDIYYCTNSEALL